MNSVDRYNQLTALINESEQTIITSNFKGREVGRQWFRLKKNMMDNGQLDAAVFSAYKSLLGSSNGSFLPNEKIQSNIKGFAIAYQMCESRIPQPCNEKMVKDSVANTLNQMLMMGTINNNIRKAIERVYGININARKQSVGMA